MVGFCGTLGSVRGHTDEFRASLRWSGREAATTYTDDRLAVTAVSHQFDAEPRPAWVDESVAIWLWGSVWGFEDERGEYVRPDEPPAAYCASLYESYGEAFVSGLNGNFLGLIYDSAAGELTAFTDRLGTHPLHYATLEDGVVFSTDIQGLTAHPAVGAEFDLEYLAEYFALNRVFGVKTPLVGVEQVQPASLTTFSLDGSGPDVERYWRPVYEPTDRSHSFYAEQLADRIEQAAVERTDADTDYGLLLSGGSDSRLTLAALTSAGHPVHAYHINDWENEEARLARRAAEAVDADFTFLRRADDYQARALASTPRISTFGGYFNQVHAGGFEETIAADIDVLFTGHYGDMLFKGNHLPSPTVDLGPLGSFDLPMEAQIQSLEEFVDHRANEAPPYLADALDRSIREIYAANVTREGDRIVDHGVEYESLREAVLCSRCPLTNGTSHFFYYGTLQMHPSGTLFLDNRLLDLFLTIPIEHLLRGNLINRAVELLAPDLADIPHGYTGVPLKYPFAVHWLGTLGSEFKRRHFPDPTPNEHSTQGPWSNHAELIRTQPFVRETLDEHEQLVRELPFLSWEAVNECYESHLAGENNLQELYTLVTFLNMPATRRSVRRERPGDDRSDGTTVSR